jgi:hypothetical protein
MIATQVAEARGTLLARIGSHDLARDAVAALEEAFELHPYRHGLVDRFVEALEIAGQKARAPEVRSRCVQRE